MTTTPPMFCFVIPCFNEENNVEPTVGSVRKAMGVRNDYEIILVNDASTDHTLERMRALAATDARIRVLDNPTNLGFGGARQRGAGVVTAAHVQMIPGDDGFPRKNISGMVTQCGGADNTIPYAANAARGVGCEA